MRRAMVVSPRPGDAVFSCGGTLAGVARAGWHVVLVTVFADREEGSGAPARAEDRAAAEVLGLTGSVGLPLAEREAAAPAAAREPAAADRAAARVAALLGPVLDAERPERIFAPTGLAGDPHARAVGVALRWLAHPAPVVLYRDAPAALSDPLSRPLPDERGIPVAAHLSRKLDASAAFSSRIAAAFGDEPAMRAALTAFAEREGRRLGVGAPAEALVEPPRDRRRRRSADDARERAALVRALRAAHRG